VGKVLAHGERLSINLPTPGEIRIFSLTGRIIDAKKFDAGSYQMKLPSAAGIYLVQMKQGNIIRTTKVQRL